MVNSKTFGNCALCGAETELTFEHIPPRKAFNWFSAKSITGNEIMRLLENDRLPWDTHGLKYLNQQRGIGGYYLCQSCNNLTGTFYGDEYVKFTKFLHSALVAKKPKPNDFLHFKISDVRPMQIFKQIISMFCSVNHHIWDDERLEMLRDYVLNKESTKIDKDRYKIYMYLLGEGKSKLIPLTIKANFTKDFSNCKIEAISEIAFYPAGFVLYFDPANEMKHIGADITDFGSCDYNATAELELYLPVKECNTLFPTDYRSKSEVIMFKENEKECYERE